MAERPSPLAAINATVRFLLELLALGSFGYWGYVTGTGAFRFAFALVVPLAVAVVWGLFGSPAAPYRLDPPWRTGLELAVLGGAALALYAAARPMLAVAFAVVAALNTAVLYATENPFTH